VVDLFKGAFSFRRQAKVQALSLSHMFNAIFHYEDI
jgi:hypothetical protein